MSEFSCSVCGDGGDVLCCDSCPKVFHMSCLAMTEEPESFKCSYCVLKRDSSGGATSAAAAAPARSNDADSTFSNDSDEPTILDSKPASSSAAAISSSAVIAAAAAAASHDDGSCRVCHSSYCDVACVRCHASFHAVCAGSLSVDPSMFLCKECLVLGKEAPPMAQTGNKAAATGTPAASAVASASPSAAGAERSHKKKGASSSAAAAGGAADKRPSRKKNKPHQHLPAFINASSSVPPPQPLLHGRRYPSDGTAAAAAASRPGMASFPLTADGCVQGHKRKPKPRLRPENVASLGILLRAIHYDFVHKPKPTATAASAATAAAPATQAQQEEKKSEDDGLAPMELDGPATTTATASAEAQAPASTVLASDASAAAPTAAAASSPAAPAAAATAASAAASPAAPAVPSAPSAPSLRALLSRGGCSCTSLFHSPGSPRPLLSALDVASCQQRLLTAHEQHRDLVFKLEKHVEQCDLDWQEAVSAHLKRMFPAQAALIAAQSEAGLSHIQLQPSEMDSSAVPAAVSARIASNLSRYLTDSESHQRVRSALAAIASLDQSFQSVKARFRRNFDRPFREFEEHDRYYQILDDARLYLLTMHPVDRNHREVVLPKDEAGRTVDPPPLSPPLSSLEWQAILEEWWAEVRALQSNLPSHGFGLEKIPPASSFALCTPVFDPAVLCFRCEALCSGRDELARHMDEQHWKGALSPEDAAAGAASAKGTTIMPPTAATTQNDSAEDEHKEAAGATVGQKRKQASSPSPTSSSAVSATAVSSSSSLVQQLLSRSQAALSADPAFLSTLSAHLSSPETALRFEHLLREMNQQQLQQQQQQGSTTAAAAESPAEHTADGPAKRARVSADNDAVSAAPAAAAASSSSPSASAAGVPAESAASNAFCAHVMDPEYRPTQAQWAALYPVRNEIVGKLFW